MNSDNELFTDIGFSWDRSTIPADVAVHSIERVCFRFQRMLPEFVWDAAALEGNPFTYPEVKTLLDGITVGGRMLSDQEQVLNLAESSKRLLSLVKTGTFFPDKKTFCQLHSIIARNEALEWGHFRGEGEETNYTPVVGLGEYGHYIPIATSKGALELNSTFELALAALDRYIVGPFEKALIFFLHGALQQYFFDGNKRTSRAMMNGVLMSHGMDAISIPAASVHEFNEKMVHFYRTREATGMTSFLSGLLIR